MTGLARPGSLLTDEDRAALADVAARVAGMSSAIEAEFRNDLPDRERRQVYLCACMREGEDGHPGCNTLVDEPGWCGHCFNSRECRPELATPRLVEWACSLLERFAAWARDFNYRRRRDRRNFAEEVGDRRWSEDGSSRFEVSGTYRERQERGYKPYDLPLDEFVVVARDGSWIIP